jgi:soluble lytic murein transglycosylase-like protein
MVRLTHLSGSLQGTASSSPKAVIRIGRGNDCDVRFNAQLDTKVSTHHAEIRFEGDDYYVVDTGSSNGTLVNGKLVRKQRLRKGDKIAFGKGGPEVRFELDDSMPASFGATRSPPAGNQTLAIGAAPAPRFVPPMQQPPAAPRAADGDADQLARAAQQKIATARAMSGGNNSGQTMFIMAETLQQVQQVTHTKEKRRYGKIIAVVLIISCCVAAGLGFIIYDQQRQMEAMTQKKEGFDKQIQKIQLQMQLESDPDRLAELEQQLALYTGKAQAVIGEVEQKDKTKAAELADQGDELDREIRRILRKFDADTYAVPPIFKERLKHHIEATVARSNTKQVWQRKKQYWPIITREFSKIGLPEEMAYVAWTESQFDPFAQSAVGARGMWQFMPATARQYGLRVDDNWRDGGRDDRTDVARLTPAAAKYLANLLSEFGSDSFMLAIASYNKGEGGMRKVLHEVGFRKEQRDFWHLYRLKKLPEETLEYVPQILAAAIIGNNPKQYGLEP